MARFRLCENVAKRSNSYRLASVEAERWAHYKLINIQRKIIMEEVNLIVMIEVKPGKQGLQVDAYKKLKPLVLAEPGCLQYELFFDAENEDKFVLIERWASASALQAHDQTEHMIAADAYSPTFRARPVTVIKMAAVKA